MFRWEFQKFFCDLFRNGFGNSFRSFFENSSTNLGIFSKATDSSTVICFRSSPRNSCRNCYPENTSVTYSRSSSKKSSQSYSGRFFGNFLVSFYRNCSRSTFRNLFCRNSSSSSSKNPLKFLSKYHPVILPAISSENLPEVFQEILLVILLEKKF